MIADLPFPMHAFPLIGDCKAFPGQNNILHLGHFNIVMIFNSFVRIREEKQF